VVLQRQSGTAKAVDVLAELYRKKEQALIRLASEEMKVRSNEPELSVPQVRQRAYANLEGALMLQRGTLERELPGFALEVYHQPDASPIMRAHAAYALHLSNAPPKGNLKERDNERDIQKASPAPIQTPERQRSTVVNDRTNSIPLSPQRKTQNAVAAIAPRPAVQRTSSDLPDDLVGEEHVREEFGVNKFTTPSIRELFELLRGLGKLPYDTLKRPISRDTPTDRVLVSLGLGSIISDGFLIVQCEEVYAMEDVGRALIKYGKVLGAGARMNRHTQSLFEYSIEGEWEELRSELSLTQADVEIEMVTLRDEDIAHLVSLGGWLRAFQIASLAVEKSYTAERSVCLNRRDIAEYYLKRLNNLDPSLRDNDSLKRLRAGLTMLIPLLDEAKGQPLSLDRVKVLSQTASVLARIVTDPQTPGRPSK
jgi:hypothetical protein